MLNFELIRKEEEIRNILPDIISTFGNAPEHNMEHFFCESISQEMYPVLARFNNGMGLCILVDEDETEWSVFSEPISDENNKAQIVIEFIKQIFKKKATKKVILELYKETRKDLLKNMPGGLRACALNYTLIWPVFEMESYDTTLSGKYFKKLRHTRNQFYNNHKVEVANTREVSKESLKEVVKKWKIHRSGRDRAYREGYNYLIDNNFPSAVSSRAIIVDNVPVAFNAGWPIAGSDSIYYAAIGLHDYSLSELGEIMNLEDLEWIKNQGYKKADFGGGEKKLTNFKKQFGPSSYYKSHVFSIVKK